MTVAIFVFSGAAGLAFWNAIAGRFEGDRLERSLRLPFGRYCLHVHHWLYCLVIMGVLYSWDLTGPATGGFLCGSIVQGLTYRDWYLLVYDRAKGDALYSRWRP